MHRGDWRDCGLERSPDALVTSHFIYKTRMPSSFFRNAFPSSFIFLHLPSSPLFFLSFISPLLLHFFSLHIFHGCHILAALPRERLKKDNFIERSPDDNHISRQFSSTSICSNPIMSIMDNASTTLPPTTSNTSGVT